MNQQKETVFKFSKDCDWPLKANTQKQHMGLPSWTGAPGTVTHTSSRSAPSPAQDVWGLTFNAKQSRIKLLQNRTGGAEGPELEYTAQLSIITHLYYNETTEKYNTLTARAFQRKDTEVMNGKLAWDTVCAHRSCPKCVKYMCMNREIKRLRSEWLCRYYWLMRKWLFHHKHIFTLKKMGGEKSEGHVRKTWSVLRFPAA